MSKQCLHEQVVQLPEWGCPWCEINRLGEEVQRYENGRVILTGMVDDLKLKLQQVTLERDGMLERIAEQDRFITGHLSTRSDDKRDIDSVIAHLRYGDSDGQDHDDAADEIEKLREQLRSATTVRDVGPEEYAP